MNIRMWKIVFAVNKHNLTKKIKWSGEKIWQNKHGLISIANSHRCPTSNRISPNVHHLSFSRCHWLIRFVTITTTNASLTIIRQQTISPALPRNSELTVVTNLLCIQQTVLTFPQYLWHIVRWSHEMVGTLPLMREIRGEGRVSGQLMGCQLLCSTVGRGFHRMFHPILDSSMDVSKWHFPYQKPRARHPNQISNLYIHVGKSSITNSDWSCQILSRFPNILKGGGKEEREAQNIIPWV